MRSPPSLARPNAASPVATRILLLPQGLANQIAAGEVVERPASVVKELLENSVDAQARRVEIDIEQGGATLIGVRDDGGGIHRDDLMLALSRHATSKIATLADLESVRSLGFRGEALPSIASVSRLRLASRVGGAETGFEVRVDGAIGASDPAPLSLPTGTLVEVRDLFFNTPARRKFLRSGRTEYQHIEDVVRRIALSHFHLAIKLTHNQRLAFALPSANDDAAGVRRLARLAGKRFVDNALRVEFGSGDLRLWGWVGLPEGASTRSDLQLVFLNGRAVRDRTIAHAIRQAYAGDLAPGAHPEFVLYLEMDPTRADVNVHPAKHEVRFHEARLVHDFVYGAVRRALADPQRVGVGVGEDVPVGPAATALALGGRPADGIAQPVSAYRGLPSRERRPEPSVEGTLGSALALLHDRFVLAINRHGMVLVDWRAARRHRDLDKLRGEAARGSIAKRPLLVPARVTVATAQADRLDAGAPELERFGIELRRVGPEMLALHEVPIVMAAVDPARLVSEIASFMATRGGPPRLEDDGAPAMLALLAEHSARHGESPRTLPELDAFLRDIESVTLARSSTGLPEGIAWCKQLAEEDLVMMMGGKA
jgi:DNA mismatch repair protein MutL